MSFSLPHNLYQEYIAGQKYAMVDRVQANFDACINAASSVEQSLGSTNARLVLASPEAEGLVPAGGQSGQVFGVSSDGQSYGFKSLAPAYQIGEFRSWFEQTPPPGWAVRNGAVLTAADEQYLELWTYLQQDENTWKIKTLPEWTALSTAAGGVGGVPFFVLDAAAKTIKLPDTRGDYERGAGSTFLSSVGAWHGDAIRNILGTLGRVVHGNNINNVSGAFYNQETSPGGLTGNGSVVMQHVNMNVSLVVPTASENRTRAFAVLPCVYVGGI